MSNDPYQQQQFWNTPITPIEKFREEYSKLKGENFKIPINFASQQRMKRYKGINEFKK